MKINNTNNVYDLRQKNINLKQYIVKGVTIFALAMSLTACKDEKNDKSNYYEKIYIDNLKESEKINFDNEFLSLYNQDEYVINNIDYNSMEVYIVKCLDNKVHLIISGNNNLDILTNESFNEERLNICLFKDSSIFYELYQNKIINSNVFNISSNSIQSWDGLRHNNTRELYTENKTNLEYNKKFGR